MGAFVLAGALLAASDARSQEAETIVSHAYNFFGEPKYAAGFEHLDYVNPDAPRGGEIVLSSIGTFDSFNRYAIAGSFETYSTIGSERIMVGAADDPYSAYCFLCETIEYPEDLSWVALNLRDDVTFQDGTPMTAEDVLFSFNLFAEQGIPEYRNIIAGYIDRVEVESPTRIVYYFDDSAPRRDRVGLTNGTIFSKAWFEERGQRLDERTDEPIMGTGRYVLGEFDFNRFVEYRARPDYWGEDHPLNVGGQTYDTIRVEYFSDQDVAFEAFKAGEYTFRVEGSEANWSTGYDFPAVRDGYVVQESIPQNTVGYRRSLVFNLDRPAWQDIRVRQAIEQMFNFEWSNESLFYKLYERPVSFWSYTELAATGAPAEGEVAILQPLVEEGLLPAEILTDEVASPQVNDVSRNEPGRSVRRSSAALLEEAGYTFENGTYVKDGKPLELVILNYTQQFDRIINPMVENLQALGIAARMERVDFSQYVQRREDGDFDMVLHGFQMGYEPSIDLRQWFGSETAEQSSRNMMRLRDEAVDRVIDAVVAAETLDELTTAVHALDRVLRLRRFDVPLYDRDEVWLAYYDMFRHPDELPQLAVGHTDFWWQDQEAAERLRAAGALR